MLIVQQLRMPLYGALVSLAYIEYSNNWLILGGDIDRVLVPPILLVLRTSQLHVVAGFLR